MSQSASRVTWQLVLAVAGVVFLGFPLALPILLWLTGLPFGRANFDYLLPFELFPATLLGVALILAAAVWSKRRWVWAVSTVGLAVIFTAAGLAWAVVSGVANEPAEPGDWRVLLASAFLIVAGAGLVANLAVGGMVVRDLLAARRHSAVGTA